MSIQLACSVMFDDPVEPCQTFITVDKDGEVSRYLQTGMAFYHNPPLPPLNIPGPLNEYHETARCELHGAPAVMVEDMWMAYAAARNRHNYWWCEFCEINHPPGDCPNPDNDDFHEDEPTWVDTANDAMRTLDRTLVRNTESRVRPRSFDLLLVGYGEPDFTPYL